MQPGNFESVSGGFGDITGFNDNPGSFVDDSTSDQESDVANKNKKAKFSAFDVSDSDI